MATTESSEVRKFVHSVRRELLTSAGLEEHVDEDNSAEELPPLPIADPAEGTPAPTLADLPRPRARGTLPPPIPGVALKGTPFRPASPPPLPAAARTISPAPLARPTIKAPSTLIIPDHLDSSDDSSDTNELDFPALVPDGEQWVSEPSSIDLPIPRKSRRPWLIGTFAFVAIAGGSALAAYLSLPHPDSTAAVTPTSVALAPAAPTPVVTPIIVEPEATAIAIAIPPAPQAVVETNELQLRTPTTTTRAAPKPARTERRVAATKTRSTVAKPQAKKQPAAARPVPADPGILMVGAKPPCAIYVDGKDTGLTTPQRSIELAPGTHKVTLINATYSIKKSFKVKITAGEKTRAIHDLTDAIKSE